MRPYLPVFFLLSTGCGAILALDTDETRSGGAAGVAGASGMGGGSAGAGGAGAGGGGTGGAGLAGQGGAGAGGAGGKGGAGAGGAGMAGAGAGGAGMAGAGAGGAGMAGAGAGGAGMAGAGAGGAGMGGAGAGGAGGAGAGGAGMAGAGAGGTGSVFPIVTSTTFDPAQDLWLVDGSQFNGPISVVGYGLQSHLVWVQQGADVQYANCTFPEGTPCSGWTSWALTSTPAAPAASVTSGVVDGAGHFITFHLGTNGRIHRLAYDDFKAQVVATTLTPDQMQFAPGAAVAPTTGVIDVFAVGLDGKLRVLRAMPLTATWDELGGPTLASAPAAVFDGPQSLHVFATDDSGKLVHRWREGATWHDWDDWGGTLASGPAVTSWGPGRLDVVARDKAGSIVYRALREDGALAPAWTEVNLAGTVGAPTSYTYGNGQLVVFARTADAKIKKTHLVP